MCIDQDPEAGCARVDKGSTVTLTVSRARRGRGPRRSRTDSPPTRRTVLQQLDLEVGPQPETIDTIEADT